MNSVANECFRFWSKSQVDTAVRAEHVCHNRITTTFDAFEKKRRATFGDHAAVDLGQLEVRINLGFDGDDFVFSCKSIEECTQARMHLGFIRGLLDLSQTHACLPRFGFAQTFFDFVVGDLGGFSDVWLV